MTRPGAVMRAADRRLACWLFTSCVLLYVATAAGVLVYGDDISMFAVTRALSSGHLDVPRGTPAAVEGVGGRFYSKASVGQSIVALPFFAAGSLAARWWSDNAVVDDAGIVRASALIYVVMLVGAFATALAAATLFRVCRAVGLSVAAAISAAGALATCTFAWHYARTFMTEPTSMAALLASFHGVLDFSDQHDRRSLVRSGAAAGAAILVHAPNLIVVAVIGVWLLHELGWLARERRDRLRHAAAWAAPIAAALALIAIYDARRFGSPLETGYGDEALAFTTPVLVGLAGLLFSPGKSVFVYAPILIAGVIGWPGFARRRPAAAGAAAAICLGYVMLFARYYQWYGGGVWGPRFLVVVLPFVLIGLGALVDDFSDRAAATAALWLLAAVSAAIQVVSVVVPYIPYQSQANRSPEAFAAFLWSPRASAVIVETVSLVTREFPPDFAPVYYHSRALAVLQAAAFAGALAAGARVVTLTAASRSSRVPRNSSSGRPQGSAAIRAVDSTTVGPGR